MFGKRNGIVEKIREASPHCIFIKCVCHSASLAVSHASKILPRALEQLVRDIYGYFSYSAKRIREFSEFQEFLGSEKHKMLRHYDIRWLSLSSCVARILEQWEPLKLYFQNQFLLDRILSSQQIFNVLSDPITKLYFAFLDYLLPIVDKFNVIFQGSYSNIQNLYTDCEAVFKQVLSSFVSLQHIKSTATKDIDPKSTQFHCELKNLYLGTKVALLLKNLKENKIAFSETSTKVQDFLQICKNFLIELSLQLKSRLPFDSELIKSLSFLDPLSILNCELNSIIEISNKCPNLVSEEDIPALDAEWRDLIISDFPQRKCWKTEEFWYEMNQLRGPDGKQRFPILSKFALVLLSVPVSNADCERIFSQKTLLKTKTRNKLLTNNIASQITIKEGLKKNDCSCVSFEPTDNMVKQFTSVNVYGN